MRMQEPRTIQSYSIMLPKEPGLVHCSNSTLQIEAGMVPIKTRAQTLHISYWLKLIFNPDCPTSLIFQDKF